MDTVNSNLFPIFLIGFLLVIVVLLNMNSKEKFLDKKDPIIKQIKPTKKIKKVTWANNDEFFQDDKNNQRFSEFQNKNTVNWHKNKPIRDIKDNFLFSKQWQKEFKQFNQKNKNQQSNLIDSFTLADAYNVNNNIKSTNIESFKNNFDGSRFKNNYLNNNQFSTINEQVLTNNWSRSTLDLNLNCNRETFKNENAYINQQAQDEHFDYLISGVDNIIGNTQNTVYLNKTAPIPTNENQNFQPWKLEKLDYFYTLPS